MPPNQTSTLFFLLHRLTPCRNGYFQVLLKLPTGTHRMRFVVDNELRCSDILPSATDSMGNLVNYIEVGFPEDEDESMEPLSRQTGPASQIEGNEDENRMDYEQQRQPPPGFETKSTNPTERDYDMMSNDEDDAAALSTTGYSRFTEEVPEEPILVFSSEIPSVFTDPEIMEQFVASDFVTPPQLPPHLESVILNSNSNEKDNNSVLPIPNHVVLNHLATTSIKHNVLAVASISRYSRKYVTQILYAPL